jgi:hypothetical protein
MKTKKEREKKKKSQLLPNRSTLEGLSHRCESKNTKKAYFSPL